MGRPLTELEQELTAALGRSMDREAKLKDTLEFLRERVKRLEGGLRLCIGLDTNTPWANVRQEDVDSYCNAWAKLAEDQD